MERKVRNAAKALIIQDDKMLAIKISDGKEEWYIMPGGGQDAEELLPDTVCREVAEELGISKQGVSDSIKRSEKTLYDTEEKLQLLKQHLQKGDK